MNILFFFVIFVHIETNYGSTILNGGRKKSKYGNAPGGGCDQPRSCDFGCKRRCSRCPPCRWWSCSKPCCECKSCFPSLAEVHLPNGKSVIMSELRIGDQVQAVSSDGTLTYSKVKTFLKSQPTVTTMYKTLTTSTNKTIRVSGNHLIYARQNSGNFVAIYANEVSIGSEVLVDSANSLVPAKVINVSSFMMQGAYVPLTMEGNIMVDGVLASCYLSTNHDLAHIPMLPIQWFPDIVEQIFGEEKGFSVFVITLEVLGKWGLPFWALEQYF